MLKCTRASLSFSVGAIFIIAKTGITISRGQEGFGSISVARHSARPLKKDRKLGDGANCRGACAFCLHFFYNNYLFFLSSLSSSSPPSFSLSLFSLFCSRFKSLARPQSESLLPLARPRVPRRARDVARARLAHLYKRKLHEVASIRVVVRLDAKDSVPLCGEAVKGFQSNGEGREVELDQELFF